MMICRIEGELVAAQDGRVELACGALTYELMVPAVEQQPLSGSLGTRIEFYTLHVLESQGQGAVYVPRLFGLRSAQQRAFFELLYTVKGRGARQALRPIRVPSRGSAPGHGATAGPTPPPSRLPSACARHPQFFIPISYPPPPIGPVKTR